jgi:uncharacterized protein
MNSLLKKNIEGIKKICEHHHINELFVFGSVNQPSFNDKSDIDFLYEFDTSKVDFDNIEKSEYDYLDNFYQFEKSLKKLLKRKIDLVPQKEIKNKYFLQTINESKVLIFSKNGH